MKLNSRKKRLETRYIVLIVIVIITFFIGILSFVIGDNRKLTPIEGGVKDVVVTIQKVLYTPFRFIGSKMDDYKKMHTIYKKYKKINNEESKIKSIVEENKELKRELQSMKGILNLNTTMTNYNIVNATVITRNVGDWYNTITLDKGSHDGIKNNMAVIVNEGLIGHIIKTTSFTSEVKLLTTSDLNSRISIGINSNNNITYGLLNGYDYHNNFLLIDDITDDTVISKGDIVITSGLSNLFPKGIIIGEVDSVVSGTYGISKTVKVKPVTNFNDIRYVSIIKK